MRKFIQISQYRNWKLPGYCKYLYSIIVEVNSIKEYIAIMLNKEKLVAKPARHYFISSTIDPMLFIWEVKGADIEA